MKTATIIMLLVSGMFLGMSLVVTMPESFGLYEMPPIVPELTVPVTEPIIVAEKKPAWTVLFKCDSTPYKITKDLWKVSCCCYIEENGWTRSAEWCAWETVNLRDIPKAEKRLRKAGEFIIKPTQDAVDKLNKQ